MNEVNRNEAPKGYYARGEEDNCTCRECAFLLYNQDCSLPQGKYSCMSPFRKDNCNVIFKKEKENK